METKKCAKCECEKDIKSFRRNKTNGNLGVENGYKGKLRKPKPKFEVPEGCMYVKSHKIRGRILSI